MDVHTETNLGFEDNPWFVADSQYDAADATEYEHEVFDLITPKHNSSSLIKKYKQLGMADDAGPKNCEKYDSDKDNRRTIIMGLMLTQSEADALLNLAKYYRGSRSYEFPGPGGSLCIPLVSDDERTKFQLDIWHGGVRLQKDTFQSRAHQTIILARLDIGGPPHRNPDGTKIPSPHLHIYREGYNDKWAFMLPEIYSNVSDRHLTLNQFMDYCNVVDKPTISRGLFE